jgi:hypothetical protein
MKRLCTVLLVTGAITAAGCAREGTPDGPPPAPPDAPAAPAAPASPEGDDSARGTDARPPDAAAVQEPRVPGPATREPEFREVTIPEGTTLRVELHTTVSSEKSEIEDAVRGTLRTGVSVDGTEVLPAGTPLAGTVTIAERSARVKGRARVGFRFTHVDPSDDGERIAIRTNTYIVQAQATKKQDAAKIGGGAVGGAIVGGLLGGGDGAAKGAAIGGAAGTGVVLATRGKEVTLPAGTPVSVKLAAPVMVRVRR